MKITPFLASGLLSENSLTKYPIFREIGNAHALTSVPEVGEAELKISQKKYTSYQIEYLISSDHIYSLGKLLRSYLNSVINNLTRIVFTKINVESGLLLSNKQCYQSTFNHKRSYHTESTLSSRCPPRRCTNLTVAVNGVLPRRHCLPKLALLATPPPAKTILHLYVHRRGLLY